MVKVIDYELWPGVGVGEETPVGGWVEENMRNWIIQRRMRGEIGFKKKF